MDVSEIKLDGAGIPYLPICSVVAIPTETELHRFQNVKNTVWIEEDLSLPSTAGGKKGLIKITGYYGGNETLRFVGRTVPSALFAWQVL